MRSNAEFVPPNTVSIKGYVLSDTETWPEYSGRDQIAATGQYTTLKSMGSTTAPWSPTGMATRYFMLFDTENQHRRETRYFRFLVIFAMFMTVSSAGGGFWLAIRVIAPVTRLAEQVSQAEPGDPTLSLSKLARNDEVGELARTFDRYLRRLREFIERESYFTADVSHELRTPLAIILGTVEVMEQDETLSAKQRERIARIKRAVQDMIELTNALLLMAREHVPSAEEHALPCWRGGAKLRR